MYMINESETLISVKFDSCMHLLTPLPGPGHKRRGRTALPGVDAGKRSTVGALERGTRTRNTEVFGRNCLRTQAVE